MLYTLQLSTRLLLLVLLFVCLCICLWAITFECLNIETSFLVWWYILTISRSSLSIKVKVTFVNGFLDTNIKFLCYNQLTILIWSSKSRSSQGQYHFEVKVIPESNCVSVWISITNERLAFEWMHSCFSLIFSTAESGQLCYTNRCGVVVIGIVVVVGGMVNFLNFDLTIGCLPLIWIVWIKECLFWRFQENPCIIDKVISQNVHLFLDYIQLLMIGRVIWAKNVDQNTKKWKRPPKSSKNKMFVFGLCSTSDDRPSNPGKKCWPKCEKMKKAPQVIEK